MQTSQSSSVGAGYAGMGGSNGAMSPGHGASGVPPPLYATSDKAVAGSTAPPTYPEQQQQQQSNTFSNNTVQQQQQQPPTQRKDYSRYCLGLLWDEGEYYYHTVKQVHSEAVLQANFILSGQGEPELRGIKAMPLRQACGDNSQIFGKLQRLQGGCDPKSQIAAVFFVQTQGRTIQAGVTMINNDNSANKRLRQEADAKFASEGVGAGVVSAGPPQPQTPASLPLVRSSEQLQGLGSRKNSEHVSDWLTHQEPPGFGTGSQRKNPSAAAGFTSVVDRQTPGHQQLPSGEAPPPRESKSPVVSPKVRLLSRSPPTQGYGPRLEDAPQTESTPTPRRTCAAADAAAAAGPLSPRSMGAASMVTESDVQEIRDEISTLRQSLDAVAKAQSQMAGSVRGAEDRVEEICHLFEESHTVGPYLGNGTNALAAVRSEIDGDIVDVLRTLEHRLGSMETKVYGEVQRGKVTSEVNNTREVDSGSADGNQGAAGPSSLEGKVKIGLCLVMAFLAYILMPPLDILMPSLDTLMPSSLGGAASSSDKDAKTSEEKTAPPVMDVAKKVAQVETTSGATEGAGWLASVFGEAEEKIKEVVPEVVVPELVEPAGWSLPWPLGSAPPPPPPPKPKILPPEPPSLIWWVAEKAVIWVLPGGGIGFVLRFLFRRFWR